MFTKLSSSTLTQPCTVNSYVSPSFSGHQNKKFRGPFVTKAPGLWNRPLGHSKNCDSSVYVL